MEGNRFDYIIIGNGLAGLQLALAMADDAFFDSKSIALIDPSEKNQNDKTWCFWEARAGKWDNLINKTWSETIFASANRVSKFYLEPYKYKMLRSIDFYNYSIETLKKKSNVHFFIDEVSSVEKQKIITKNGLSLEAKHHIFDSRLPEAYHQKEDQHIHIYQHFKGLIIETENDYFNPEVFTTMDYRIKHNNDTTFTYVLPISNRKALVEFTFFTPYLVKDNIYDDYLKKYITSILKIDNYTITETEQGIIPMTNFPFHQYNTNYCTKIGTGGGWVKGSTGYSFKHTEKKVAEIIMNLKRGVHPNKNLFSKKYQFYDSIFLKVLHDENTKGEWIFEQFYTKNKVSTMFKFLDEESSLTEDFAIMKSLFSYSFIKAFFKTIL